MSTYSSKFVWHDLMTTDVEGAKRFYGELLGWTFKVGTGEPYVHIKSGDRDIGGIMKVQQPGTPAHWLGYVSVDDVNQSVALVQKNGGKLYAPTMDIPNVGQFAVAADPSGAAFAPFHYTGKGMNEAETNELPAPFTFCWDELVTTDPAAAAKFYGAVFGWGAKHMEMPGMAGGYTLLKRTGVKNERGEDKDAGGVMQIPPGAPYPPFWLTYIAVPDADAAAAKVKQLGGQVMMEPMDIPNVGRFFPAMDPQHAAVAFLGPNK